METASKFLREAARYFGGRPTGGEDSAFWSNVTNADNCIKIAEILENIAKTSKKKNSRMETVALRKNLKVAACYDCGLPYNDPGFSDLVVPNDIWLKISPTGHEGGLLCPSCMVKHAVLAGLHNIEAKFTSGPFAPSQRLVVPAK